MTLHDLETMLLAEGSHFHTVREVVCGEEMTVFSQRAPHLRALLERSLAFGDRRYVIFGEQTLTYAEHFELVCACATLLREEYGVGKGDRVAILAANRPEWVLTFWAAISLGALPVGMNGWWVGPEIEYALGDCAPKVLVADDKRLARLQGEPPCPVLRMDGGLRARLEAGRHRGLSQVEIAEDDDAAILYSSGTTGRPKGIVATHRNIVALVGIQTFHGARVKLYEKARRGQPIAFDPPSEPPPALVTTPLFHVSGLYAGIITRLATGGTTIWSVGRFDAGEVLGLIERYGVGGWGPTATMVRRVLDHPDFDVRDTTSMEFIGMGGSHIPERLVREARARFTKAGHAAAVGYGLTEACALVSIHFGEEYDARPDSVGRPLPTVEVEIRDPQGRRLPEGELGEICVRSPLVLARYWGDEAATASAFWPDRWLRTGDLGSMRDGYLYMPARRRDLIIRGGENIYPAEIEQVLEAHPGVREAAVIGVDDDELGQVPVAVVVPAGPALDASELYQYLEANLAYFKLPVSVQFRETPLPRNASDKVLKHVLEAGKESSFAPS